MRVHTALAAGMAALALAAPALPAQAEAKIKEQHRPVKPCAPALGGQDG